MPDSEHNAFAELVLVFLDGKADEAQVAALNAQLEADAEKRALFVEMSLQPGLLKEALASELVAPSSPTTARRSKAPAIAWGIFAAAACVLAAIGIWQMASQDPGPPRVDNRPSPPAVQLVAHWKITPTGNANFEVVEPTVVHLDRGELLIESTEINDELKQRDISRTPLRIKTPNGEAVATGTRFYIGTHPPQKNEERAMLKSTSRVLILSGVVTLTTAMGSIEGTPGDLLAAEADNAPTKLVARANSDFAFELYRQLSSESPGENLFFSPYSVSSALAMTAEGARQETAAEMGRVLGFPNVARRIGDDDQLIPWETALIHTGMAELNRKLNGAGGDSAAVAEIRAKITMLRNELKSVRAKVKQLQAASQWKLANTERRKEPAIVAKLNAELAKVDQYEIRVANALWGEKTYPFDPEYVATIHKHYDTGGIFPVDFKNAFEAERLKINDWIEEQTNDRIQDLLPEGSLDQLTRLVLTNAIYFKGDWSIPFQQENTQDRNFTLADGTKQKTPIMHEPQLEVGRYGAFNSDGSHFNTPLRIRAGQDPQGHYPTADGFAIVELPYKGDDLAMVVIAPNDPARLPAIEAQLTQDNLNRWIGHLQQRETNVSLPKFKMETDYNLGDAGAPGPLQKMGMVRAFIPPNPVNGAQFQGLTTSTDPLDQLHISKVIHKAFVEVNETGTEAAAATAVMLAEEADLSDLGVPFTPVFQADRPFVFLIREKSTGSVLFLGRVTQPTAQAMPQQ